MPASKRTNREGGRSMAQAVEGSEQQKKAAESGEKAAKVDTLRARHDTPGTPKPLVYDKHSLQTADGKPLVVVHPVRVDGTNRRSDDDALEGAKCEVVSGPHKGRKGVFLKVDSHDANSGYPAQVIVRTSDDEHELLSVAYGDIRPGTVR